MIRWAILSLLAFILSCNQNPLEKIPKAIQDGALTAGEHNLPVFEESLYKRLVKVSLRGQPGQVMEFKEGQARAYHIHIQPLYNLGLKYKIQLGNEPVSILSQEKAKWIFDSETNIAVLEWKPSQTFTNDKPYETFSLPLLLEFWDRRSPSTKPAFAVQRAIGAIVYKTMDEPEIYKITTAYNEYEKLDDGNFYTKNSAQHLDLSRYNKIFAGVEKQKEIFSHLKFYSQTIYSRFYEVSAIELEGNEEWTHKEFDEFKIQDKFQKFVPYRLLDFIKQPIYYPARAKTGPEDCDLKETVSKNQSEWCLGQLNIKTNPVIDFNEPVYIKHYKIPAEMAFNDLFYKIESPLLCETYHSISLAFAAGRESWDSAAHIPCYLPMNKAYNAREEIKESEDIYLLSAKGELKLIDKTKWEFDFYKIPQSIKMQLGGHQPVTDNVLRLSLAASAGNDIQIYLKDYNRLKQAPLLIPAQKSHERIFWTSFPINAQWRAGQPERIDKDKWKLNYSVDLDDEKSHSDKDYGFNRFNISLQPVSQMMAGAPVFFQFFTLPQVTGQYLELFDPAKDVKISTNAESPLEEKWLSFSVFSKIKARYILPSGFLSNIYQAIPFNEAPFYKDSDVSGQKALDHLIIKDLLPLSQPICKEARGQISAEKRMMDVFYQGDCQCSKWTESGSGGDGPVYLESLCSYQAEWKAKFGSLKDSEGELISSYWPYDYYLSGYQEISLSNKAHKDSLISALPVRLQREPFAPQYNPPVKTPYIGNRIHIFFNLKPSLQCVSESDSSDKKCKISYLLKEFSQYYSDLDNTSFFSEDGALAQISCSKGLAVHSDEGANVCPCDKKPVFSPQGIEWECVFQRDQKGSLFVHLSTNSPYIYFVNVDAGKDEILHNYKKTPVEALEIH